MSGAGPWRKTQPLHACCFGGEAIGITGEPNGPVTAAHVADVRAEHADLLLAAPALLEAVTKHRDDVETLLRWMTTGQWDQEAAHTLLHLMRDDARAAIAAARGGGR